MSSEETVARLAKKAVQVQDACNPIAVAGLLHQSMLELSRAGFDHPGVAGHPVTIAILDKLVSLCDYNTETMFDAHHECDLLSESD